MVVLIGAASAVVSGALTHREVIQTVGVSGVLLTACYLLAHARRTSFSVALDIVRDVLIGAAYTFCFAASVAMSVWALDTTVITVLSGADDMRQDFLIATLQAGAACFFALGSRACAPPLLSARTGHWSYSLNVATVLVLWLASGTLLTAIACSIAPTGSGLAAPLGAAVAVATFVFGIAGGRMSSLRQEAASLVTALDQLWVALAAGNELSDAHREAYLAVERQIAFGHAGLLVGTRRRGADRPLLIALLYIGARLGAPVTGLPPNVQTYLDRTTAEDEAAFRADAAATIVSFRAQLVFRAVTMGRGATGAFSDRSTAAQRS
ncbi:hypothetical protein DEJ31_15285 [Curtobacterium sp. MCPF17_031]|nr:hypothetical protein DEJ31_15285 [Curtobacterium sp. MCPF17_031]